jgi:hypothetical protein
VHGQIRDDGTTALNALLGILPRAEVMGAVGLLVLFTNGAVAVMLYRHRAGDANMGSMWICSASDGLASFFDMCAVVVGENMNKKASATAVFLMCVGAAYGADADKEREPSAILEIGGASEWNLQNGAANLGPSVAVEFDAIKEWLELEAGFSPLLKKGNSPEWSTDLLFKKPFTLSNTVEFMISTDLTNSRPNSRSISCSGPGPIARSVGSWNRPTPTRSARARAGSGYQRGVAHTDSMIRWLDTDYLAAGALDRVTTTAIEWGLRTKCAFRGWLIAANRTAV